MEWYTISYQKRLFAYLLLGGVLPLLIVSTIILYAADRAYESTQEKAGYAEVQRISREIDNLALAYQRLMMPFFMRDDVMAYMHGEPTDTTHLYADLYGVLSGRTGEAAVYLLPADGRRAIATDDVPRDHRLPTNLHWGVIGQAVQQDGWALIAADRTAPDQQNTVFSMAHAIRQNGKLLGAVVVDIRREALVPLIQRVQDGNEGQIILTDRYRYVMMDLLDHHGEGFSALFASAAEDETSASVFRDFVNSSAVTGIAVHLRQRTDGTPVEELIRLILAVDAAALAVTAYLAWRLSRRLWHPLHILTQAMRRARSSDDFSTQLEAHRRDEIGELARTFNGLIAHIRTLLAENRARERRLRIAEVKSLTEMTRPHFIYNTLNLIKWSAKLGDAEGAADIAVQLGKILRASVSMKEFVTVAEELSFLRTYLKIQQRRFEGRLKVTLDVDSRIMGCYVPKLILQPLVENAIQHGLESVESGGRILIVGRRDGDHILLRVKDDGQGMSEARQQEVLARQDDNHFGLYNVHMRAMLNGDAGCGIDLSSAEGKGTEVRLTLKYMEEAPRDD